MNNDIINLKWWKYQPCVYSIWHIQYIPRNMHTVFALLCFVVVIHWLIAPYPSGLLHWHCGNLTIAPVPAKQPWWIWINTPYEFIMNDCITTTKQSTTKPCAYFLGYTVYVHMRSSNQEPSCLCGMRVSCIYINDNVSWYIVSPHHQVSQNSAASFYLWFIKIRYFVKLRKI